MSVTGDVLVSGLNDIGHEPLAAEVDIDPRQYMRIMRRIGIQDAESLTPVSAFNSSI